jgi:hypothetical protein
MTDTPKKPLPNTGKTGTAKPVPDAPAPAAPSVPAAAETGKESEEFGGRGGSDPTRFGDWEKDGRCVDF